MAIFYDKKCSFVHIPKTGGTTIISVLSEMYNLEAVGIAVKTGPHYDILQIKESLGNKFNSHFKFGFVRNPWDRAVSIYSKRYTGEFKDFLRQFKNSSDFDGNCSNRPKRYYLDWFQDAQGNLLVDYIGRFENFQNDLLHVCRKLGLVPKTVPHLGPSKHKHYTEYYDQEGIDIIRKRFDKDIEFFGYEFGKE